ncbi:fungal-specific transcription factor domain-containing protein [Aspergillus avenaceus]|uniref:Fungal-specific transcription factor domain-containing protein n=1 Tax=Aspergillus avenaceus TaxID=36643 RepID=A0A5N6U143_ASPAV|nr:fungal-specific transcription factor domain-containing protein [Aspergillus avenaceus]
MINRLETGIERMEARLQDMGVKLIDDTLVDTTEAQLPALPIYESSEHETLAADPNSGLVFTHGGVDGPPSLTSFLIPRSLADVSTTGGFSVISQRGMEWISQKAGKVSTEHLSALLLAKDDETNSGTPFVSPLPNRIFCPLPPMEEAISLLHDYIRDFNTILPVFKRPELVSLFTQDNLEMKFRSPSQWASINAILATALILRPCQTDSQKSWLFIQNALEVVNELWLGPPDLLAVQSLLVIATFLLGTSAVQPCGYLVSTAIRLCHDLGLGNTEDKLPLSAEEAQHRQTIFWIAYWLDRELCLRFGEPPTSSDDDFGAALPMEAPTDSIYSIPTSDLSGNFNAFRSACQLATIKGQLYQDLYSATAVDRPIDEIISSVGTLDEKLQAWKKNIPTEYQPESGNRTGSWQPTMSPILLLLHYSYFDCMIAIHRRVAAQGVHTGVDLLRRNDLTPSPDTLSNPRVLLSASLCTKAARASISLTNYISREHTPLLGTLIYYPVVASITLSNCVIHNPQDICGSYYLQLVDHTERFLASLSYYKYFDGIKRLVKQCAEYRSIAEAAIKAAL